MALHAGYAVILREQHFFVNEGYLCRQYWERRKGKNNC